MNVIAPRRSPRLAAMAAAANAAAPAPPPPPAAPPALPPAAPAQGLAVGAAPPNANLLRLLAAPVTHVTEMMCQDQVGHILLKRDNVESVMTADQGVVGMWEMRAKLLMRLLFDGASTPAVLMQAAAALRTTLESAQHWGTAVKAFVGFPLRDLGHAKAALLRLSGNGTPSLLFTAQKLLLACDLSNNNNGFFARLSAKAVFVDGNNQQLYHHCLADATGPQNDYHLMVQPGVQAVPFVAPVPAQQAAVLAAQAQPALAVLAPAPGLPYMPLPPAIVVAPGPAPSAQGPIPQPPPGNRPRRQSTPSSPSVTGSEDSDDDDQAPPPGAGGVSVAVPQPVPAIVHAQVAIPIASQPAPNAAQHRIQQRNQSQSSGAQGPHPLRARSPSVSHGAQGPDPLRAHSPSLSTGRSLSPPSLTGSGSSSEHDSDDPQDGAPGVVATVSQQDGVADESKSSAELVEASRSSGRSNRGREGSDEMRDRSLSQEDVSLLDRGLADNGQNGGSMDGSALSNDRAGNDMLSTGSQDAGLDWMDGVLIPDDFVDVDADAGSPDVRTALGLDDQPGEVMSVGSVSCHTGRALSERPEVGVESNGSRRQPTSTFTEGDDTMEGVASIRTGSLSQDTSYTNLTRSPDSDTTSTPHVSWMLRNHVERAPTADEEVIEQGYGQDEDDDQMGVLGEDDDDSGSGRVDREYGELEYEDDSTTTEDVNNAGERSSVLSVQGRSSVDVESRADEVRALLDSHKMRGERCVGCGSETCIRIHYGAPSCHGCKAFFRRSVFEGRVYLCSADNNCDITNESRNRCRSCRLRNCLDGGMNPKHVREERNKLEKLGPSSNISESRTGTPPEEHPLTLFLTALEKQCEQLTENDGKAETRALDQLCPHAAAHFRSLELPDTVLREPMSWQCVRMVSEVDLQHAWYKTFVYLADWAMSIPDFRMLHQADQSSLFCQNLSTFGWLHFAYKCYTNGYSHLGIPIGNGSFIPYEDPGSPSANTLGRRLIDTVVHPMREMDMDEEEYCVLKTLALFQMDCALSASAHSIASRQREKILEALATHLERKFPMMTQSQRLARAVKGTLLFPSLMVIHALYPLFSTTPVKK